MNNTGLIPFYRTEYIQDKLLVEKTLEEAKIEFEITAPKVMTANSIYQEQGPWEFYTSRDQLYDAEKCVNLLPVDNLLKSPQDAPNNTSIQKLWAWVVIAIIAAMIARVAYSFIKMLSR